MTDTDPRTDLAGYLGLTDEQAEDCRRRSAPAFHPGSVYTKVGARLIEQDQARADEPDDGLIAVTVRLTAEEVRATAAIHPNSFPRLDGHGVSAWKLNAACRAIDLPAPKPPWKSPLDDLPDLTERQCDYLAKLAAWYPCDVNDSVLVLVGRALIAAGYTPGEGAEQTISYDYTSENKPDVGVTIDPAGGRMVIKTLEGEMHASPGDWIIRGVQGEFYPCKPDIFEQTYEPVEEADRD